MPRKDDILARARADHAGPSGRSRISLRPMRLRTDWRSCGARHDPRAGLKAFGPQAMRLHDLVAVGYDSDRGHRLWFLDDAGAAKHPDCRGQDRFRFEMELAGRAAEWDRVPR